MFNTATATVATAASFLAISTDKAKAYTPVATKAIVLLSARAAARTAAWWDAEGQEQFTIAAVALLSAAVFALGLAALAVAKAAQLTQKYWPTVALVTHAKVSEWDAKVGRWFAPIEAAVKAQAQALASRVSSVVEAELASIGSELLTVAMSKGLYL